MRKEVDKVIKSGTLGVNVTPTGETFATAPTPANANDNSTKIATTAWVRKALNTSNGALGTWNKAANGYLKFSNGIIIQWGYANFKAAGTTITLPTAYTITNYPIVFSGLAAANHWVVGALLTQNTQTKTKFTAHGYIEGGTRDWNAYWISIGY